ncbi:MAG: type II toxin-antitoxin system RelE/ParE family toxin [Lachnospiraceae bacterium]|nr:type II toxin-antitoxin system RelE/ParE family toxin [Lachnospiraceae bacterium]
MYNIEFYRAENGDCDFVLLHHFRKKTQKTPKREIEKAKTERDDWVSRKG